MILKLLAKNVTHAYSQNATLFRNIVRLSHAQTKPTMVIISTTVKDVVPGASPVKGALTKSIKWKKGLNST